MTQPDIQDRLQQALGTAYIFERELYYRAPDGAIMEVTFSRYGREAPLVFTLVTNWPARVR